MGVPQFLSKVLGSAGRPVDLRYYSDVPEGRRLRVAVDVSAWIYKACQGFSDTLGDERYLDNYGRAQLQQKQDDERKKPASAQADPALDFRIQQYVHTCTKYVTKRVERLKQEVDVLVVFDGETPPTKVSQVKERASKRKEAIKLRDAPVKDDEDISLRIKAFRRAGAGGHHLLVVDAIIQSLRSECTPFIVSPYEADGQLAFLSEHGYVDLVVTEDSDLMACGASPVLYKALAASKDDDEGLRGIMLRQEDLASATDLDLMDFSTAMLAVAFCAAGSDYAQSLRGVGLKSACDAVRKSFQVNPSKVKHRPPLELFFEQIYQLAWDRRRLTEESKEDYERDFLGALLTFRHPVIFNPITARCEHFRSEGDPELMLYPPYANLFGDMVARSALVGRLRPSPLACYVSEGWLNPRTLEKRNYSRLPDYVETFLRTHNAKIPPRPPIALLEACDPKTLSVFDHSKRLAEEKRQEQEDLQPLETQQEGTKDDATERVAVDIASPLRADLEFESQAMPMETQDPGMQLPEDDAASESGKNDSPAEMQELETQRLEDDVETARATVENSSLDAGGASARPL
jgi:5'-3' exonuclease